MKIAIIGAGLSGLACASELLKNGIAPAIFEKRSHIGQEHNYPTPVFRILDGTPPNPPGYFKKKYGFNISQNRVLRKCTIVGPSKSTVVRGNLGCTYKRGDEEDSVENRIGAFLKKYIEFDTYVNINDIKNNFDYIVVATGDFTFAKESGLFSPSFVSQVRIATLIGRFDENSCKIWLDNNYTKNWLGFLLPWTDKEARLLFEVDNIPFYELDYYWKEFLIQREIRYTISETREFEMLHGSIKAVRINNVFFTGKATGTFDNILGFSTLNSVESGILAARSIIYGLDYGELLEPLRKKTGILNDFRAFIRTLGTEDLDRLVVLLGSPDVERLVLTSRSGKTDDEMLISELIDNLEGCLV